MLTTISGTQDKEKIRAATSHYIAGLLSFISPQILSRSKHAFFAELANLHEVVKERVEEVIPHLTEILWSINERAYTIKSPQHLELARHEWSLWSESDQADFGVGVRACVDAGLTREAVAGSGAHLGRSLAGDDELVYIPELGAFRLVESVIKKKLIHAGRGGTKEFLEMLIEHTGCGRRSQMLANLSLHSEVTHNFDVVFNHIDSLLDDQTFLSTIRHIWPSQMTKDGGVWAGIWVKKAQKQAYQAIKETKLVVPIVLYDKMNGNVYAGIDREEVLLDPFVIAHGGFTEEVLTALAKDGKVWSLSHELQGWQTVTDRLSVKRGVHTFSDLQHDWLTVKQTLIQVSADLWTSTVELQDSLDRYIKLSGMAEERDVVKRRYLHQLLRMFAYTWVLDTFSRGNAPGRHMEDHLASGESSVLGVKEHLPLGQGGLQVPTAAEFFTGRSVLLHSTPGKEGKPIVVLMKHDTSEVDTRPLSGEETQRAMDDFAELLKLWPYIVIGDIVPVIAVRNKTHMGISRLALSIVLSFGDIVHLSANERLSRHNGDRYGSLPEIVPATNTRGEVVSVPASDVLRVGIVARRDLSRFRELVTEIADTYSNETAQAIFRSVVN